MNRLLDQKNRFAVPQNRDTVFWSKVRQSYFGFFLAAFCLFFSVNLRESQACPFCGPPQLTISEQISQTDAAVIAEWVSGVKPDFDAGTAGSTVYQLKKLINSPDKPALEVGQEITVAGYYPGEKGSPVFILGTLDGEMSWMSPLDISEQGIEYVNSAPSPEDDPAKRLVFFVKYLEASDPLVADDAYAEFSNAPYKTIVSVKEKFPRKKLRKWVFSEEISVVRLGLYGLMLGLCGDEEDQKLLKAKVIENDEQFRLGIDGIMAGYLLLAGKEGLTVLEEAKLKPSLETPSKVPFSETFSALQAVKFMWEYGDEQISPERLRASQRILLESPTLADLVIIDLARWEDWSVLPRLKKMYAQEPFDVPAIKRSIIGFLIQCIKQKPKEEEKAVPAFVTEAEKFLADLEQTDPKTVKVARLLYR